MIYPDSFEHKIDFTAVRDAVRRGCVTDEGRQYCADMAFAGDYGEVERRLALTAEMLSIVSGASDIAIGRVRSVSGPLRAIRPPGTHIPVKDLCDLRTTLEATGEIIVWFQNHRLDNGASPYPRLQAIVADLYAFPECLQLINKTIDQHGNVRDSASPDLADIRRNLRSLQSSLGSRMRRVLQNAILAGFIPADATPSVRDGRLVLPVAPMYKRKISGIVHDESASGKTVFIEPAEVVEANNRIRELEMEERREIIKVLTAVADVLRGHLDDLLGVLDMLGEIDFIHAKAAYARSIDASMPTLHPEPGIEWYHAVHPVLLSSLQRQGKEVVPLDITLTPDRRILVISGPNAGGKSVCIKTVAIVQYMLQCGLLPPVYENSHAGVFTDIMIDIGDDQSMEDDLSTYSSHLRNMKLMLQRGRSSSLIILDEFGSGTEPQIGGAIAQAILAELNEKGVWGVITSHYQNIKTFAEDTPGIVNGSMLYDRHLMRPMFRLSIGSAGSSFAVEIARKIGLPASIIDSAEQIVGSDYINLDKYLLDIARDKRYWEQKRMQIRAKEKKIDDAVERYENLAEQLRTQRREIIGDARREAEKIIADSNAGIERAIREIRESQADKERTRAAREKLRREAEAIEKKEAEDSRLRRLKKGEGRRPRAPQEQGGARGRGPAPATLTAGSIVKLDGKGTPGTIVEISGTKATVVFGMLKTTVSLSRLMPTNDKLPEPVRTSNITADRTRLNEFKTEVDLRGMRVDEALQAVTYLIDDALRYSVRRVRILHGTGTGALREAIRQQLRATPGVTAFRDEDVRFGGAGITVVDL